MIYVGVSFCYYYYYYFSLLGLLWFVCVSSVILCIPQLRHVLFDHKSMWSLFIGLFWCVSVSSDVCQTLLTCAAFLRAKKSWRHAVAPSAPATPWILAPPLPPPPPPKWSVHTLSLLHARSPPLALALSQKTPLPLSHTPPLPPNGLWHTFSLSLALSPPLPPTARSYPFAKSLSFSLWNSSAFFEAFLKVSRARGSTCSDHNWFGTQPLGCFWALKMTVKWCNPTGAVAQGQDIRDQNRCGWGGCCHDAVDVWNNI